MPCLDWKRKSDDDPIKTLDTLWSAMKDIIEDARREKVREEELRAAAIREGESETIRLRMPPGLRIVVFPPEPKLPPLMAGATSGTQ